MNKPATPIRFLDIACGDGERVKELSEKRGLLPKNDEIIGVDPNSSKDFVVKQDGLGYLRNLPKGTKVKILNMDFLHLDYVGKDPYMDYYMQLFRLAKERLTYNGRFYLTLPCFSASTIGSELKDTGLVPISFSFADGLPEHGISGVRNATRSIINHKNRPQIGNIYSTVLGKKYSFSEPVRIIIKKRRMALENTGYEIRSRLTALFGPEKLFKGDRLAHLPEAEFTKSLF